MSRRVPAVLSHEQCSGHSAPSPEGPKSCTSTAGASHRGHGHNQGCIPHQDTGQGASAAAPGHPSSPQEPETSLVGEFTAGNIQLQPGGEAEQDTPGPSYGMYESA